MMHDDFNLEMFQANAERIRQAFRLAELEGYRFCFDGGGVDMWITCHMDANETHGEVAPLLDFEDGTDGVKVHDA